MEELLGNKTGGGSERIPPSLLSETTDGVSVASVASVASNASVVSAAFVASVASVLAVHMLRSSLNMVELCPTFPRCAWDEESRRCGYDWTE